MKLEAERKLRVELIAAVEEEHETCSRCLQPVCVGCVTGLSVTSGEGMTILQPFSIDQRLKLRNQSSRQFDKVNELTCRPRTVLQSGLRIICTRDVTIIAESRPFPPCTKTGAASWARHCATIHAELRLFNTNESHPEVSSRDSHFSVDEFVSLHASISFEKQSKIPEGWLKFPIGLRTFFHWL